MSGGVIINGVVASNYIYLSGMLISASITPIVFLILLEGSVSFREKFDNQGFVAWILLSIVNPIPDASIHFHKNSPTFSLPQILNRCHRFDAARTVFFWWLGI
jgi:hypothetical protein